jgi:hypothetical protein
MITSKKDNEHLEYQHICRYEEAKQLTVKFMLFDIDHNITTENNQVSDVIIIKLANLINLKRIGIGFVSGRPEENSNFNGQDIITVVNKLLPLIDPCLLKNLIIFPEYAGYGVNIGTGKIYDYGFIKSFEKNKEILLTNLYNNKYSWLSYIEIKRTGLSLWVKPRLCYRNNLAQYIDTIDTLLENLDLREEYVVINGAYRTVDILHNKVNKVRSREEIATIYKIPLESIATSDDQADHIEGGYLFTEHPLGFATGSFYKKSTKQIATKLSFNKIGIDANLKLINELHFEKLN